MRALLVDDEHGGLVSLRTALQAIDDVEVVGECRTFSSALDALEDLKPDLVFLDVGLGSESGLTLLDHLAADDPPLVVFVTAHAEHAAAAFDLNATDYVVKPFEPSRLERAVRRASRRRYLRKALDGDAESPAATPARGEASPSPPAGIDRLMVRKDEVIRFVRIERVVRLEASGNYVTTVTDEGTFDIRSTLKDLLARLDPSVFVRVHRSHVVNLDRVAEIHPWFGGDHQVVMDNGDEVRLSRSFRDQVLRGGR
jgi:two-component system LytT family response regulator